MPYSQGQVAASNPRSRLPDDLLRPLGKPPELTKTKSHFQRMSLGRVLLIHDLAPPYVLETLRVLLSPYFFEQRYCAAEHVIPSPLVPNRAEFYNLRLC
jgi:hypothetical protein